MSPRSLGQPHIGRCLHSCGDLQHAVESHHWSEPAIESKHELVEIALQVLRTDPVMGSKKPRIKVPEYNVDHGEVLVSLGMITRTGNALCWYPSFCKLS